MSDKHIFRIETRIGYSIIPNDIMNNDALNAEAVGVLVYLLSKPDNWEVRDHQLRERFGFGRDKLAGVIKILKAAGYFRRRQYRNSQGQFVTVTDVFDHVVAPDPNPTVPAKTVAGSPVAGSPVAGSPVSGKHVSLVNTELPNTELQNKELDDALQNFLPYFKQLGHSFTKQQTKNAIIAALGKYGLQDTIAAYERAIENGAENVGFYAAGILRNGGIKQQGDNSTNGIRADHSREERSRHQQNPNVLADRIAALTVG